MKEEYHILFNFKPYKQSFFSSTQTAIERFKNFMEILNKEYAHYSIHLKFNIPTKLPDAEEIKEICAIAKNYPHIALDVQTQNNDASLLPLITSLLKEGCNLETIYIRQLDSVSIGCLAEALEGTLGHTSEGNTTLKRLYLVESKFDYETTLKFSALLPNLSKLTFLDLSHNNLDDRDILVIASFLNQAKDTLTTLGLNNNYISDIGVGPLCTILEKNHNLKFMALNNNKLTKHSLKLLTKTISKNTNTPLPFISLHVDDEDHTKQSFTSTYKALSQSLQDLKLSSSETLESKPYPLNRMSSSPAILGTTEESSADLHRTF